MIYELKHTDTTDNKIITELSNRFSELLCEHLGDDIINKVIQDNKTSKYGCNSNDYCDANQIMIDALDYVFGEYWELSDDDIHNLINASWTMSMKNEFKQVEPILTLDEFKKSRKKVNLAFMQEHYSFGDYGGQSVDDSDHLDPEFYVYGVDGGFGWIEIRDTENSNNSMKFFLQISNWDACSDDLDYFEKKLYEDHYLHNI